MFRIVFNCFYSIIWDYKTQEVEQHLKLFTFLNDREIDQIMQKHKVWQLLRLASIVRMY